MAKFQLLVRDEYGQTSIVDSSDNKLDLLKRGKKEVNSINAENALTDEDRKRNWEAYLVEFAPEENSESSGAIYAGKDGHGKNIFLNYNNDIEMLDNKTPGIIKIYLGELNKKNWYADDGRGREINVLSHPELTSKTFYYIRKI